MNRGLSIAHFLMDWIRPKGQRSLLWISRGMPKASSISCFFGSVPTFYVKYKIIMFFSSTYSRSAGVDSIQ